MQRNSPTNQNRQGHCPVAGCSNQIYARRLCSKHYRKERANGDPNHNSDWGARKTITKQGYVVWQENGRENLELWSSSQPAGQRVADKVRWDLTAAGAEQGAGVDERVPVNPTLLTLAGPGVELPAGRQAGRQADATTRITDLETAWDQATATLKPRNPTEWDVVDSKIDMVLRTLRGTNPQADTEKASLTGPLSEFAAPTGA